MKNKKGKSKTMAKPKSCKGRERRRHRRYEYPLYITYKKNGKKFEQELVKSSRPFHSAVQDANLSISHNVSVGGICFVTKEKFPPGTRLLLKIWSPIRNEPFTGLAEVIWQQKKPRTTNYLTGAAFASLDNKEELKKLLQILAESKIETMMEK